MGGATVPGLVWAVGATALELSSTSWVGSHFMDYDALRQRDTADKGYNLPKQRGLATTFVFEDLLSYSYDLGEAGEGDAATEAGGFGKSFTLTDVNFGGLEGDSSVSNSGRGDGYFVDGTLFRGNQFDGHLGLSVSAAGDINGDGVDDVVVGASGTRHAYVFFGQDSFFEFRRKLRERGSYDWVVSSLPTDSVLPIKNSDEDKDDGFGEIVSAAGDINGDGFDDVLISAPSAKNKRGRVYVVYGSESGLCCDTLDVKNELVSTGKGFHITGENEGDYFGSSLSGAFDFDDDAIDDILVGADGYNDGEGAAALIYGRENFASEEFFADIAGQGGKANPRGVLITVADSTMANVGSQSAAIGSSVAALDDVNGDDVDDVAVGAAGYARNGAVFVVFGGSKIAGKLKLDELDGTDGFAAYGVGKGDKFGTSVSKAGDFNGDGYGDVIVGAPGLCQHDGGRCGAERQVRVGYDGFSVSSAGDIDSDGLDDVLVGAFLSSPVGLELAGSVFAVLGAVSKSGTIELSDLDGFTGFEMRGGNPGDLTGYDIATVGDYNNDGIDDIALSAFRSSAAVREGGALYVIFGMAYTSPPTMKPSGPSMAPTSDAGTGAPTSTPFPSAMPSPAPTALPTATKAPTMTLAPTTNSPSMTPTFEVAAPAPSSSLAPTITPAPTSSREPTGVPQITTPMPTTPSPTPITNPPTMSPAPSTAETVAPSFTMAPTTLLSRYLAATVGYVFTEIRIENMTEADLGREEVLVVQYATFDILGTNSAGLIDSTEAIQNVTATDIASIDLSFFVELAPPSAYATTPLAAVETVNGAIADALDSGLLAERLAYWASYFGAHNSIADVNADVTATKLDDSLASDFYFDIPDETPTDPAPTIMPVAAPTTTGGGDGGSKKSDDDLSAGAISGIVIACAFFLFCIVGAIFFVIRQQRDEDEIKEIHGDDQDPRVEEEGPVESENIATDDVLMSKAGVPRITDDDDDDEALAVVEAPPSADTGIQEKIIEADL
ncbi:hypothetical protein CTAYLR_010071 [Chrysophaeum taylorii]|uniref:Uncharacterized protein n=1 Tax=Chrysophaeum taylorii TaxID=2483200 RepID=A0AAD7XLK8_9STRA|nr:hypothetical protein CTAYLR_010071 [Chrysophaeum taylorii]